MLVLLKAFLVGVAEGAGYALGKWFMGQVLSVNFVCERCGERFVGRIGNQQMNHLGCTNCSAEVIQFTNACDFTLGANGQIAHAGAKFLGGWNVNRDPYDGQTYKGWLFFNAVMKSHNLLGKQFVLAAELSDYNTGIVYSRKDRIYAPSYMTTVWSQNFTIDLPWRDIPEYLRDSRIWAADVEVKSEWGDPLWNDRLLATLWK